MLAERWWFWAAVAVTAVAIALTEPRWRSAAVTLRSGALRRRLVEEGAGMTVASAAGGRWSEPWLPAFLVGLWVCGSPWIWGYHDVDGAIGTDVVTGAVIAVVSLAGVLLPPVLSMNLFAGLWLTTAPWLVGFGTHAGPVGVSDTVAGVVTCGLALHGLSAATRRLRAAQPGPIGRMPRRGPN
ncbi:MAG: SPW repeat protein [Solirubrobacterales bacterium]